MFHVQALFNAFTLFFSWFALANLWLTFSIIIELVPAGEDPLYLFGTKDITHWVNNAFVWLYGATLGLQFILALGNRPKGERVSYVFSFVIFGVRAVCLPMFINCKLTLPCLYCRSSATTCSHAPSS